MRASAKVLMILVAGLAGIAALGRFLPSPPHGDAGQTAKETEVLFATKFPDTSGHMQALSQWRGAVLVVNFWATWCPPCREEMPEFNGLQKKYATRGLVMLGIATDGAEQVREFAAGTNTSYPLLVGDIEGTNLSAKLGNDRDILPYTVVINRQGRIVSSIFGRIHKEELEQLLVTLF